MLLNSPLFFYISVPSNGPGSILITAEVTNISIRWSEVDCAERNGVISGYSIRYGLSSSSARETVAITTTGSRTFNAERLMIRSSYSFEVAAVNRRGVGTYSSAVTGSTSVPTSMTNL